MTIPFRGSGVDDRTNAIQSIKQVSKSRETCSTGENKDYHRAMHFQPIYGRFLCERYRSMGIHCVTTLVEHMLSLPDELREKEGVVNQ